MPGKKGGGARNRGGAGKDGAPAIPVASSTPSQSEDVSETDAGKSPILLKEKAPATRTTDNKSTAGADKVGADKDSKKGKKNKGASNASNKDDVYEYSSILHFQTS